MADRPVPAHSPAEIIAMLRKALKEAEAADAATEAMSSSFQVDVWLTADELLLLRQRLSFGPGTPAADSVLDAKLYDGQRRLERHHQRIP